MSECRIIMLGTGDAMVTRCYNTCFVIETPAARLLVDAGGGNGILVQLVKAGVDLNGVNDMFVTHAHTDHVLGAVWVVRSVIAGMKKHRRGGEFRIYGHDRVLHVLESICRMTLAKSYTDYLGTAVKFCEVRDGDEFAAGDMRITCFDRFSTKEKQFGFSALLPGGKRLVCLGDEPYREQNRKYAEAADWLMSEAFCLYADRERFKPYEKSHSTARDAGICAGRLNVRNLVLYHTEDETLSTRKSRYAEEARENFTGNVYVPDDLEVIEIM